MQPRHHQLHGSQALTLEDDDIRYGITVCDECSYSPFWNGMHVG